MVMKPAWLEGLIGESFFVGCGVHKNRKKNEKNIFCLRCSTSLCPCCLPSHHPSHPLLQVRRYVYNSVVRLGDVKKLIDCSYIQPYTINRAKVVFLNQRPQSRQFKSAPNACLACDRILQEPFHFCSLSCKVGHMVEEGGDLSSILHRFDESDLEFSRFEDSSEAMEEEEEDAASSYTIVDQFKASPSCSSEFISNNSGMSQDSGVVEKKGLKGRFPELLLSIPRRRKGSPKRSPLS